MGLMQKAVETYDNMAHLVGEQITPVSHIIQNAQIEITLDRDGNFVSAQAVSKDDMKTMLPATEKSGSRTGDAEPHALSDQLEYLQADKEKSAAYLSGLEKWAASPYAHPKVIAVLQFIRSGKLLSLLEEQGLIKLKADGTLDDGKINGTNYAKCLVRWRVLNTGGNDEAWRDKSLMEAYAAYYEEEMEKRTPYLCMITGEESPAARYNPKGVVSFTYGAKLVSANDTSGFTYRGRFKTAEEAATIGYEASQKAHAALSWLTATDGVLIGGRTFVTWNPKGLRVQKAPSPLKNFQQKKPPTPTAYRRELYVTLSGLRDELPDREDVVLAAFDAATTGRLSLTYYNELKAGDFHERLRRWYETCAWYNGTFGIQSPPIQRIAEAAFGTERSTGFLELDDKVLREQVQRLLSCLTDCAPVPYDIVAALVNRASSPQSHPKSWRRVVFIACALLRKYEFERREIDVMSWELDNPDRSFQFGRLLALMERAETMYYQTSGEERQANAIKQLSRFRRRPWDVYCYVDEILKRAYLPRLTPAQRIYYQKTKDSIVDSIRRSNEDLNAPLSNLYLLGYDMQHNAFYSGNKTDNTIDTEEENQ